MAYHIVISLLILIVIVSSLIFLHKILLRMGRIKNKTEILIYSQISLGDGTNEEDEEEENETEQEKKDEELSQQNGPIESSSILIEPNQS